MEELLNKLIEKGWKPRGFEKVYNFGIKNGYTVLNTKKANYISFTTISYTYRELVSKESGLWQFLCENGMIENGKAVHDYVIKHITYSDENHCGGYGMGDAEYYMMISALIDEPDLEEFLLDNIKIDG